MFSKTTPHLPVDPPQSPVVLTVRAEAFVDNVLPVLTNEKSWEVTAGFGWPVDKNPGVIRFPGGKFARHLRPKIFPGVFAGIPHDAFAAVVTSFYVPPHMENDWWSELAEKGPGDEVSGGPDEGGFALIWDLEHSEEGISGMGVVIASQTKTDETATFSNYFSDQDLTSECGGGTVFLAATSQNLLTRMREGCARQSLSVLDWERGSRRGEYEGAQLMMFINPGVAMRELSLAGRRREQKQDSRGGQEGNAEGGREGFLASSHFCLRGECRSGRHGPAERVYRKPRGSAMKPIRRLLVFSLLGLCTVFFRLDAGREARFT